MTRSVWISLGFILLMSLAAATAYLWVPDNSADANDMCLPLAGLPREAHVPSSDNKTQHRCRPLLHHPLLPG